MFELQSEGQQIEEEEATRNESTDLKSVVEKLNEIRAMQVQLAEKAAEIVGNKKSGVLSFCFGFDDS
jgi:hypothetical protein